MSPIPKGQNKKMVKKTDELLKIIEDAKDDIYSFLNSSDSQQQGKLDEVLKNYNEIIDYLASIKTVLGKVDLITNENKTKKQTQGTKRKSIHSFNVKEVNCVTIDNYEIRDAYTAKTFFESSLLPIYIVNPQETLKKVSLNDLKFMYYLLTEIELENKVAKTEVFGYIKSYLENQNRTKTML
ncbi:hypothetical protein [Aneurinibacillus tyrosinisolvens]|uniref:hypothetical protein n=1 Tax=Aneurinibacillus tyrosinisolvens TaxID=1443435 RepID=UPI00063EDFE0|nr:hypothetical protein [Aneurinibacillus tyrosinisolvens]